MMQNNRNAKLGFASIQCIIENLNELSTINLEIDQYITRNKEIRQ